ncbi:3-dehydro-L-gulonate 2-dehydrogenase [Compostibacter hankyongensis]|uniref:3-dehydro-L-gulonate 2-dehydrogenase n=1 Tax=Compostibacter hankyongensis TaxID=1007089 RepID=A0ABP8G8P2_9BACT
MHNIPFPELKTVFKQILLKHAFPEDRAECCARIFAENSRDGVPSHGLNRFPVFISHIKEGLIDVQAEPEQTDARGMIEQWDGRRAPGMYTATLAVARAAALAATGGMGMVVVKNTNHWMRGATYAWQAADQHCISLCTTNAMAIMPPWGGTAPRLGNNPLVIGIPRERGHLVLDMALSQFSFGKLQEYRLAGETLPVAGGFDTAGQLSKDPVAVMDAKRLLPAGYWKGAGLSFMLDALLVSLSGGRSVADIASSGKESGVSQLFLCIHSTGEHASLVEDILDFTKAGSADGSIRYPGERTLAARRRSEKEGVPVNEKIWQEVLAMV